MISGFRKSIFKRTFHPRAFAPFNICLLHFATASSTGPMGMREYRINDSSKLVLCQGDITTFAGDAIVNAANERMLGGGGVDGAIHRAAGPRLYAACKLVPEVSRGVRCPTGQARITDGFNLRAKHVIHTVGPIYFSDEESAPFLTSAYKSSLIVANEHDLKVVAFPAISTGVYGYPKEPAAEVALRAVMEAVGQVQEVHFVLFGQRMMDAWVEAAERLMVPIPIEAVEL